MKPFDHMPDGGKWIQVTKTGKVLQLYYKNHNGVWTPSSLHTKTINHWSGDTVYVGIAVRSGSSQNAQLTLKDLKIAHGDVQSKPVQCVCVYQNDKTPMKELLPDGAVLSLPSFTLSTDGIALGLRPNVACNATDDLVIESQILDTENPRQRFHITESGQVVSVACPTKVLTTILKNGRKFLVLLLTNSSMLVCVITHALICRQ